MFIIMEVRLLCQTQKKILLLKQRMNALNHDAANVLFDKSQMHAISE